MDDMRKFIVVIPLLALLAASVWFALYSWTAIEGPPMPTEGHVAMWLGIVFSLVVGCGLMALVFYSSRRGYDDAASRPFDETKS
jgi:Na+-driven multidrug efflux pump